MLKKSLYLVKRFYIEVKNVAEFENATKGKPAYVVQFSASWCNPCKQLAPVLKEKQQKSDGSWTIIKVDVDQQGNAQLCHNYQLVGVPSLLFFKNGQMVKKLVGNQPSAVLDEALSLIK